MCIYIYIYIERERDVKSKACRLEGSGQTATTHRLWIDCRKYYAMYGQIMDKLPQILHKLWTDYGQCVANITQFMYILWTNCHKC